MQLTKVDDVEVNHIEGALSLEPWDYVNSIIQFPQRRFTIFVGPNRAYVCQTVVRRWI
jgi:hypothetical protein